MEIVICAAIKTPSGEILRGHRHADCFHCFKAQKLRRDGVVIKKSEQGFITSKNRFVRRGEALKLQLAAGIQSVSPDGYRENMLFSEDLY